MKPKNLILFIMINNIIGSELKNSKIQTKKIIRNEKLLFENQYKNYINIMNGKTEIVNNYTKYYIPPLTENQINCLNASNNILETIEHNINYRIKIINDFYNEYENK